MSLQLTALAAQVLMCLAFGLCFAEESSRTSDAAALVNTSCDASGTFSNISTTAAPKSLTPVLVSWSFSFMTVSTWKHLVDLLRSRVVRWPNKSKSNFVVLLIPLLACAALIASAVGLQSGLLLSLGCSIGSVYQPELLSAVVAWKRQRLDRQCANSEIARLLNAWGRSAVVLALGLVTPIALAVSVVSSAGASTAAVSLVVCGSILWAAPFTYVILELHTWHENLNNSEQKFRNPVCGHVLLITAEKQPPRMEPAAPAAALAAL
jgi:hypothetical protein